MRMGSIASGSSGNCVYAGSEKTHILVDVGISKKRVEEGLRQYGLAPSELAGILITHEHSDHVSGLGVFTRKYQIPVYGTKETFLGIRQSSGVGSVDDSLLVEIEPEEIFYIGDLRIHPFSVFHDALNPVAYRIENGDKRIGIATDTGTFDDEIVENLSSLDSILVEANHDEHMLLAGHYPYYLKQRIAGERGHLSNEDSGHLISRILHPGLKHIILGHLSKENNYPELAYETVRMEINMAECPYRAGDFDLRIADRNAPGELLEF